MDRHWCHWPPPLVYDPVTSYYLPLERHLLNHGGYCPTGKVHYDDCNCLTCRPSESKADKIVKNQLKLKGINVPTTPMTLGRRRSELINWANYFLKANFTHIKEFCSGAPYCQLFDMLFPGIIQLTKVNFRANFELEYRRNFEILQAAFQRLRINRVIPVEALVRGYVQDNFEFLRWFKKFFLINYQGRPYNVMEARGWVSLGLNSALLQRRRHST